MVLPAAIITVILLFVATMGGNYQPDGDLSYNLLQVIPYLVVLVGALLGFNVFLVLTTGTVLSILVGCLTGALPVSEVFTAVGSGVTGMYDITVISIVVSCISTLMMEGGGIQFVLNAIRKRVRSKRGAAFGIAALSAGVDVATANNTVANCGDRRHCEKHQRRIRAGTEGNGVFARYLYFGGAGDFALRCAAFVCGGGNGDHFHRAHLV